ncbi:hypothetical protein AKN93_02520 [Thiopseudomonas alkaliphila]|uniref:GDYXXLXY domain-containing protein n=1 Tax=Thiopseudomonas alkaliphila TaxID=1697053 RepID=UPI0006A314D2|nr:GDYXXLXY domain-containing protein [Thiopseudomonas alkaliphila]AKX47383.1 hypothetical protein AKN94_08475 [Thiopseudomonas alkaliphila]AKX48406.1 hypothetical protein AKN93_02520 [Thiopseudomonas alkaliphila]AKX51201.1 hypothetical protein AKN92_06600 [Thiopseudomonas alkaliphila]AKX53529.1 hypothetical protein AKN91_07475 [Thiopseudomonas alkaliphila]AKX55506.1 hypothetical protein AKN90_07145 [Thiopseudomonas alkaliphila]
MTNLAKPKSPMTGWVLVLALLLLGLINYSIWQHERTLSQGQTVILELAPVDPRSLMQGDYMALRFALAEQIAAQQRAEPLAQQVAHTGLATLALDQQQLATLVSLEATQPLADNQVRVQYRQRNGQIQFATNAFFFQEGTASIYEQAKYGLFKVNAKGEMLLARMLDAQLQPLGVNRLLQD